MRDAVRPGRNRPMVVRVFNAVILAGISAALLDLALPGILSPGYGFRPDVRSALYILGLGALGGVLLAVLATAGTGLAILVGRGQRPSLLHPGIVLATMVLVPLFILVNRPTFSGAEISTHPLVEVFRVAFLLLGGVAILGFTRGAAGFILRSDRARRAWRWSGGALVILGAIGAHAIDATVLPGHYPNLHLQCAAVSLSLLSVGFLILGPPPALSGRRFFLAVLALSTVAALLRLDPAIAAARAGIASRTVSLRQWMALPEAVLDVVTPLAPLPVAGVAEMLAARKRDSEAAQELQGRLDQLVPGRRALNLLIISIDSLRQDHVSSAGYETRTGRRTTPNLDTLFARSLVFPRCYSGYPTSAWAYSSLLSGRDAPASPYAAVLADESIIFPPDLTLPGLLLAHGWHTSAVTAFNAETTAARALFGHLREGFDVFDRNRSRIAEDATAITGDALAELGRAGSRRFFLWVHYLDPHEPYTHHQDFDFGPSPRDRYDSEIAFCDAQVGRLLAELLRRGLADRTAIVVMSDHGEAFGEHLGRRHNSSLYDEQIRVPLVVAAPGLPAGAVDTVASLSDVLPTLVHLLGITDPHLRNGRSLLPAVLGVATHGGWAHAMLRPDGSNLGGDREALIHGRHKLIVDRRRRVEEFYDLLADPGEVRNLIAEGGPEPGVLRGILDALRTQHAGIKHGREAPAGSLPSPAEQIRSGLAQLSTLRPDTATGSVCAATTMLRDPVFGISPRFAGALGPAERRELSLRFQSLADPGNDVLTRCILCLLNRLEDPRDLAFARNFQTSSLRLFLENAVLRGVLGDRSAVPELNRLLGASSAPDRHLAASALLSLRERPSLEVPLAAAETRLPWEVARIIRGLGLIRAEELPPLASELLDHPYWREFGPIRLELAGALATFPVSPLRERLLARLAHDGEPEVVGRALGALREAHAPDRCTQWLAVGEIESDAARSLVHGSVAGAASALERSVALLPEPEPRAHEVLARLRHFLGQTPDGAAERPIPIESYMKGEFPFTVRGLDIPAFALTDAWYYIRLRIDNTGRLPWPGPETGAGFEIRPELVTPGGRIVCGEVPMDHRLPRGDVPPGGAIEILIPVCTPDAAGRLLLNLRLVRRFPDGAVQVDPLPTASDVMFDVVIGVSVDDAFQH